MLSAFKENKSTVTKRASHRRTAENCVTMIDGRAYPVYNWSEGGLLIQADERMFSLNAPVDVTMKFRLAGKILDIAHKGKIIRKARDKLAIQLEPLTRDVHTKMNQVIDDLMATEFAESQMA
jgi:hypothetical protein